MLCTVLTEKLERLYILPLANIMVPTCVSNKQDKCTSRTSKVPACRKRQS